jgi:hypothetical protein
MVNSLARQNVIIADAPSVLRKNYTGTNRIVPDSRSRRNRATELNKQHHGENRMKAPTMVGILLIVLAVIAFSYQGITYTKREKVLDIGPIQATTEKKETIPLPPILGAVALIGGVALVVVGSKH